MPLSGNSPFQKGKAILAAWFTAMWDAIRANDLTVDPTSGLEMLSTPNGKRLSIRARDTIVYAVITTTCPPFSGTTIGKGAGNIYATSYSSTGVCTIATMGINVPIYNGGAESIPSGQRVIVELIGGQFHCIVHFCNS